MAEQNLTTPDNTLQNYQTFLSSLSDGVAPHWRVSVFSFILMLSGLLLLGFTAALSLQDHVKNYPVKQSRVEKTEAANPVPGAMAANCTCPPARCQKRCHNPKPPVVTPPSETGIRASVLQEYRPVLTLPPLVVIFLVMAGTLIVLSGVALLHSHGRNLSIVQREKIKGAIDLHRAALDYLTADAAANARADAAVTFAHEQQNDLEALKKKLAADKNSDSPK